MITLETLRNSLPESEILSPWHPLALDRSWGTEYWAELLQPGVGRARANISMKNHVFPARRVLRKYGQCPTPPCYLLGWSRDPDILLLLVVGGGTISQAPS